MAARRPAKEPEHPLQTAVDAAVAAGDAAAMQTAASSIGPAPSDAERRCIAYGWLRLADAAAAAGRFADAHAHVRTAGVARGRPDAVVQILAGHTALRESRALAGEQRERMLEQAAKAYETAASLDPKRADAQEGWANALVAAARSKTSKAKSAKLLASACERYAAAVAADPSRAESWAQWGHVLVAQSAAARGDECGALLDESCVRYSKALELDPKRGAVLLAWANVLVRRSRSRAGSEAAALLDGACEKFRAAAKLLPGRAELLRAWAIALASRADIPVGDDSPADQDRLRAQAVAKCDEAVAAQPDDAASASFAAQLQLVRAAAKRGTKPAPSAKCAELAADARERLAAVTKRGGDPSLLLAAARAEALQGDAAKCVAALTRWAAAATKPSRRDLDGCPDFDFVREHEKFVAFRKDVSKPR